MQRQGETECTDYCQHAEPGESIYMDFNRC